MRTQFGYYYESFMTKIQIHARPKAYVLIALQCTSPWDGPVNRIILHRTGRELPAGCLERGNLLVFNSQV